MECDACEEIQDITRITNVSWKTYDKNLCPTCLDCECYISPTDTDLLPPDMELTVRINNNEEMQHQFYDWSTLHEAIDILRDPLYKDDVITLDFDRNTSKPVLSYSLDDYDNGVFRMELFDTYKLELCKQKHDPTIYSDFFEWRPLPGLLDKKRKVTVIKKV